MEIKCLSKIKTVKVSNAFSLLQSSEDQITFLDKKSTKNNIKTLFTGLP